MNPVLKETERLAEGMIAFRVTTLRDAWVLYAPVRRHRMSWPDWAGLASGIIANRENEIHHGSIWRGKFLPTLRAKA